MHKLSVSIGLAVVCVVLLAVFWNDSNPASGQPLPKIQQWEYKVVAHRSIDGGSGPEQKTADAIAAHFDTLGKDGWEYVGSIGLGIHAVFKRPKR